MNRKNLSSRLLQAVSSFAVATTASAVEYHSPHTLKPVNFTMSAVDLHASGSYGLIGHDVDRDGNLDLVSFAYSGTSAGPTPGEIYWYRYVGGQKPGDGPRWEKHLIAKKKHAVHGAFLDVDHDSRDDLIYLSDFEVPVQDASREGNVWWARQPEDLNAQAWESHWIGQVAGAHRVAVADLSGDGTKQVVVLPLASAGAPPFYGAVSPTLFLPRTDRRSPWQKIVFGPSSCTQCTMSSPCQSCMAKLVKIFWLQPAKACSG